MLGNDYCKCKPKLCKNGVLQNYTLPTNELTEYLSHASHKVYKPFLKTFSDLLHSCLLDERDFDNIWASCGVIRWKNIRCTDKHFRLDACYTLHTRIDRPDLEPEEVSTETTENLLFDSEKSDLNIYAEDVNLKLSFHHSRNVLNPYEYGYSLKEEVINVFRLAKTVKHLLPPPYETNCKDYFKEWENRGGRGPTSEKECIEECQMNSSLEIQGCVMHFLKAPTNERICEKSADKEVNAVVFKASHDCVVQHCKPACHEITYEVTRDFPSMTKENGHCNYRAMEKELWGATVDVKIKLAGLKTTVFTYSPKFEEIEIFSYIGGYVGMWLGISLLAVFDFIETMMLIMRYPLRQIMNQRARKHRIQHAMRGLSV